MAVSLGFGILFTTFVCLLLLPTLYVLLEGRGDKQASPN
jgi:predicted RND superfamily exporter protein